MNINDISVKRNCTSCQMCAAVCPKNAINISLDADGFYRPLIDGSICVDCGICTKVCYKFDDRITDFGNDELSKTKLYGASVKDSNVLSRTTSGGIADLLAHYLIRDGYKCIGVVYDSDKDAAISKVANSEEELIGFRGSKYIQSYTLDAFKEVVNNCQNDKFAVFGTPCHIYALDKYLCQRKVREQHMLIDLYCHGCPSMNIWKKYIKNVKVNVAKTRIDNANFRSKVRGWGSFYVVVEVDGKPIYYSDSRHNEFFDLFFSDQILNEACNDCVLRGTLAYTDIRLGDFWGKQYVMNSRGVSAVSLVTDKAKAIFEKLFCEIYYREEEYEDFLPWQSWGKKHSPNPILRIKLLEQLRDDKYTLKDSIKTIYHQQSLKRKIFRYGKNIVYALPMKLEKCIRWVFYKIH